MPVLEPQEGSNDPELSAFRHSTQLICETIEAVADTQREGSTRGLDARISEILLRFPDATDSDRNHLRAVAMSIYYLADSIRVSSERGNPTLRFPPRG